MACSSSRNHQHFDTLTNEKSESLFKGEASFLFAYVTTGQLVFVRMEYGAWAGLTSRPELLENFGSYGWKRGR